MTETDSQPASAATQEASGANSSASEAAPHSPATPRTFEPLASKLEIELEMVTPMHVGNSEALTIADVISAYGKLFRIDEGRLLEHFAEDEEALAALEAPGLVINDFLSERGLEPGELASYVLKHASSRIPADEDMLMPFARSGPDKQAYLPGSTLKGALLSGLLWMINAESRDQENPLWVSPRFESLLAECRRGPFPNDTPLQHNLLGKEPHNQLMRVLRVEDTPLPNESLAVYHAALMHRDDPKKAGYSYTGGRGRKVRNPREAAVHFIEALEPGARVPVTLFTDEFLVREAKRRKSPIKFVPEAVQRDWLSPTYILSGVNDLAFNTIYQERQYFEQAGHKQLIKAYDELFERCQNLAGHEVMLRMGWGLSWHGVTGFLWDERVAKELKLPQPRYQAYPYPKSRKIVFKGETPLGTPGWAILRVKKLTPLDATAPAH